MSGDVGIGKDLHCAPLAKAGIGGLLNSITGRRVVGVLREIKIA